MDFKLSKNKLGGLVALFLTVLLTQHNYFNFLLETFLGRSILILLILFIAHTNKFLGTAVVFIIIIMFSCFNFGYMEGFEDNEENKDDSLKVKENKEENKEDNMDKSDSSKHSDNTGDKKNTKQDKQTVDVTATEGFDIASKERYIQKGKQSNQILVNDAIRSIADIDIEPYEAGLLTAF
jgi:hypothetical protein